MEHYEWMNDQVRQEIEVLQRTYGFDKDEALAYWHLRHAGTLLLAMRRTRAPETIGGSAQIESNILQHLSALRRELQRFPKRVSLSAVDWPDLVPASRAMNLKS